MPTPPRLLFALSLFCTVAGTHAATPVTPTAQSRPLVFSVSDRLTYDDNIFRLPGSSTAAGGPGASGDRFNTSSLGLDGLWRLGLQAFSATAMVADNRFQKNDALNNVSSNAKLDWDWRLAGALSGNIGGDYNRRLADFANTQFYSKDIVTSDDYYAGANFDLGPRWRIKGKIRDEQADHGNALRTADDYRSRSGSLGIEFLLAAVDALGVDYQYTDVGFRQTVAPSPGTAQRDYDEKVVNAYLRYSLGTATIDAGAGYVNRTYARDALIAGNGRDFSGDVWHLSVTYQPDVQLGAVLKVWRDLRAYTDAESNYFVSRGVSFGPTWSPLERLRIDIAAAHETQDFVGSSTFVNAATQRRDSITYGDLLIQYDLRKRLELGLSYRHERRSSNVDFFTYRDELEFVSLQYSF